MIKLERPEFDARDVFALCISRVRDAGLKARLTAATADVVRASATYDSLATQIRLHQFARQPVVGGVVSTAEMEAIYTQRMVPRKAPGRDVYDELMASATFGKCPLCGQRDASTLDHHLPKAHYPSLAVTPLNLVPACKDCNKAKLASIPLSSNEEMLHPYFDDIDADRWLYAMVGAGVPAALRFRVEAPSQWNTVLADRVAGHFKTLGLGPLYAAQGADELLNIRHQLQTIFVAGGAETVRDELLARADSARQVRVNSWRVAAYEAFAESDWFCAGGFGEG